MSDTSPEQPDLNSSGWFVETPFDSPDFLSKVVALEPPAGSRGIVLFVAGGPLSGKSSVLARLARDSDQLIPADPVYVDPYAIREHLPEWQLLAESSDPLAAASVHKEVVYLAACLVTQTVKEGRNLVIDGIGDGGPGVFAGQMRRFHDAGYDVRVLVVDAPVEVAYARNEARAAETGRFVLPSELERLHRTGAQSHLEWSSLPWIGVWKVYGTGGE